MPIYDYRCSGCGQEIEVLQRSGDKTPIVCYVCDSVPMERKLSAGSFHLKGNGWYQTDFKGNNHA